MTRPVDDIRRAQALVERGWPLLTASQELGISRAAIRDWRDQGFDELIARRLAQGGSAGLDVGPPGSHPCDAFNRASWQPEAYSYLLGQYLGDGSISAGPKAVYKLRIFCCSDYPRIIARCVATARLVLPGKVSAVKSRDIKLVTVISHWKHMPCLFPQHGPGRKHTRPIYLAPFQQAITEAHPEHFLRGLIESDGCRSVNRVNGGEYPRYLFSNRSDDIRSLFCRTVEQLGCTWTTANRYAVAVSRRPDVELLDSFIGPKR